MLQHTLPPAAAAAAAIAAAGGAAAAAAARAAADAAASAAAAAVATATAAAAAATAAAAYSRSAQTAARLAARLAIRSTCSLPATHATGSSSSLWALFRWTPFRRRRRRGCRRCHPRGCVRFGWLGVPLQRAYRLMCLRARRGTRLSGLRGRAYRLLHRRVRRGIRVGGLRDRAFQPLHRRARRGTGWSRRRRADNSDQREQMGHGSRR
eukprot:118310-Chlamydomonas_euryale.AAC.8